MPNLEVEVFDWRIDGGEWVTAGHPSGFVRFFDEFSDKDTLTLPVRAKYNYA